jgi:hypothetical protein
MKNSNNSKKIWHSVNEFLDRHVLPWPVRFITFRFVILGTIALLIPLVVYSFKTQLVLLINSYLNVMSVTVSSIVLLYATLSEVRQNQIAELQEKRAQEDHIHVTEMHELVLRSLDNQHEEIEELKRLISLASGNSYTSTEKQPLPDLYAMHPRGAERFQSNDHRKRFQKQLHHNKMVTRIHETIIPQQNGNNSNDRRNL